MLRAFVVMLAACSVPDAADTRPAVSHHIDAAEDIRWPIERTSFRGTVRRVTSGDRTLAVLELAGDRTAIALIDPPALPAGEVSVSGIGRPVGPYEAGAGAVLALGEARIEAGAAGALRSQTDLTIAIRQTWVTAEGTLVERGGGRLALELAPATELRVMVTVDGEVEARAHLGKRVRVRAYLMRIEPDSALAIGQPTFL